MHVPVRGGEGHKEGREERRERGGDERGEGRGERREERRERGGEWRREGRGRGSVAPREALEVAKDMNAFRNDGTFAEQYLERGEGGGGAGGGDEGRRLDGREGRGAERDEDSRDDASGAGRRAREVSGCSRWDCLLTPVLCAVSRACPGLHVMLSIDTDHDPQRPSCTKM